MRKLATKTETETDGEPETVSRKKKTVKYILLSLLAVLVVYILYLGIASLIAIRKNAEEAEHFSDLDLSRTEGTFFLDDDSVETLTAEMNNTVLPFINGYKTEGYFTAKDGFNIRYANYVLPSSEKNLVIVHGYGESIDKYAEIIYYFMKSGYSVFIIDLRGHGYSDRYLDNMDKIHIENFQSYVDDFVQYLQEIVKPVTGEEPLCLYSHSLGGSIATALLEAYPEMFSASVMSSPMLDPVVKGVPRPLAVTIANTVCLVGLSEAHLPTTVTEFPTEPNYEAVSFGNPVRYEYYYYNVASPDEHYHTCTGTYGWLKAVFKGTGKINRDSELQKIVTPTLLFELEGDERVMLGAIHHFVNTVENSQLIRLNNVRHELFNGYNETLIPYFNTIIEFLDSHQ